jgi:tetratricopeptide (TPR) repeat protein
MIIKTMLTLKKNLVLFLFSLMSLAAFAQQNVKESETYKTNMQVYQTAVKYNDLAVAKDALYRLISLEPSNVSLLDSLAYMYYDNSNFVSTILVSKDIIAKDPKNVNARELTAISFQNLGLKDKALEQYESLYLLNNNINTIYQIAFLQYELKRFKEAKTSIDIILESKGLEDQRVVHATSEKTQQEVPMKASILNLKGLIDIENGNKEDAKLNFENALKLAPEFEHPKENLKKVG